VCLTAPIEPGLRAILLTLTIWLATAAAAVAYPSSSARAADPAGAQVVFGLADGIWGDLGASPFPTPTGSVARIATPAPAVPALAHGECPQLFGSFSVGRWPPACWRPYGTRSPFNTPIPANPRLSPESNAIVEYFVAHHWAFNPDRRGNFTISARGSRPVYWSTASDPVVRVSCRGSYSCQRGMRVHVPAGARPEEQSDAHMTIIDQASGREYDFWRASAPQHGEMTVSAGNSIRIGPGVGTGLGAVGEAANLGLAGGLIRAPELLSGRINHALATTAQCVQARDVWPARGHGDALCSGAGAGPHFSTLLQLNMSDAEIAASRAPAWERAVMRAMRQYGVYVVDTNGPGETVLSLINEDDLSYTAFGYPGLMSRFVRAAGGNGSVAGVPIPVSKLRVIMPCVPQRTC
jgi:hypothetical protein